MRVCLVGATGVLGRALVPLLLHRGISVRALARFTAKTRKLFPPGVDCRSCDLLSDQTVRDLPSHLAGCDAVVHAATQIPPDMTAPGAWDANTRIRTEGTRRLVEAARSSGIAIYIQQSISMAYPDMGDRWIEEDTQLDNSPARSAICAPVISMEDLVRAIPGASMRWCILRGGMFVGEGTFQETSIRRLRAGEEVVPGDGQNFISPVHVRDMALAVVLAIQSAPNASVFHINSEPVRQGEYEDALAAAVGAPKPRRDRSAASPPSFRCRSNAAKQQLGWQPRESIYPIQKTDA